MWPNSRSFEPAATPSQRELICHHFHQHGRSTHELVHLDSSHRILGRILLHCSNNQTTTLPPVGTAPSFMGPGGPIPYCFSSRVTWVPSQAVFHCYLGPVLAFFFSSRPFDTMFHQTFYPLSGWEPGMGVLIDACFFGELSRSIPWLSARPCLPGSRRRLRSCLPFSFVSSSR